MNFFGIFYHTKQNLPIVISMESEGNFIDCCKIAPCTWAYLVEKNTGVIIKAWRNY